MKKTYKLLAVLTVFLLIFTVMVGCTAQIEDIQLDNPKVTAESKFGANVISWNKIDKADGYYIYRQEITSVETTAKKAKKDNTQENVSALEYLGFVEQITRSDEELYYVDAISVTNQMKEGEKYRYTVEAIAGDASDARLATICFSTIDDEKSYVRGKGTADVIVAEGNMPDYGDPVSKPEKTTFTKYISSTKINAESGAKIVVDADILSDGKTVGTVAYAELEGYGNYSLYNNENYSTYVYQIWSEADGKTAMTLPLPGTYRIASYNYSKANSEYYEESEKVFADDTVTVSLDTNLGSKYSVPELNSYADANLVNISWTSSKKNVDAGVTYKLYSADYEYCWTNVAGNVMNIGEITEITEGIETSANSVSNSSEDGSINYNYIATTETGKKYVYFLQAYYEDALIGANVTYITGNSVSEINLKKLDEAEFVETSDKKVSVTTTTDTKDGSTTATTSTCYNYYATFQISSCEGASVELKRYVYNSKTGYSTADGDIISITPTYESVVTGTVYESSDYVNCIMYFLVEDEALPVLLGDSYYKYVLSITDPVYNSKSVYYWTTDENNNNVNYDVTINVTEKEITDKKAKYTITISDTSSKSIDLSEVEVKAIVRGKVTEAEYSSSGNTITTVNGSKYYMCVIPVKDFEPVAEGSKTATKELEIDGLSPVTTYNVIFVISSYDTGSSYSSTYESATANFTTTEIQQKSE